MPGRLYSDVCPGVLYSDVCPGVLYSDVCPGVVYSDVCPGVVYSDVCPGVVYSDVLYSAVCLLQEKESLQAANENLQQKLCVHEESRETKTGSMSIMRQSLTQIQVLDIIMVPVIHNYASFQAPPIAVDFLWSCDVRFITNRKYAFFHIFLVTLLPDNIILIY